MNRENVLRVADAIEQHSIPDLGFNMGWWHFRTDSDRSGHACGTTACIGGWTDAVLGLRSAAFSDNEHVAAQKALGLSGVQARALFYFGGARKKLWDATPAQAVAVLRHLADTGEVDWSVADKVAV